MLCDIAIEPQFGHGAGAAPAGSGSTAGPNGVAGTVWGGELGGLCSASGRPICRGQLFNAHQHLFMFIGSRLPACRPATGAVHPLASTAAADRDPFSLVVGMTSGSAIAGQRGGPFTLSWIGPSSVSSRCTRARISDVFRASRCLERTTRHVHTPGCEYRPQMLQVALKDVLLVSNNVGGSRPSFVHQHAIQPFALCVMVILGVSANGSCGGEIQMMAFAAVDSQATALRRLSLRRRLLGQLGLRRWLLGQLSLRRQLSGRLSLRRRLLGRWRLR